METAIIASLYLLGVVNAWVTKPDDPAGTQWFVVLFWPLSALMMLVFAAREAMKGR